MDKKLHIVCFDVPWPANYGGAIDVFYKIRSLHKAGVHIILHCFEYGDRLRADELEACCDTVYYYKRNTGIQGFSLLRPYIVNSRKNPLLLKRLTEIEAPILFEGLHTCYYLNHPALKERKKFARTHNVEHDYYNGLAHNESSWWRRIYYKLEAKLLKQYEVVLKEADELFAISEQDKLHFESLNNAQLVSAFHGNDVVHAKLGEGDYCLYHAKLSVPENEDAACKLIEQVFSQIKHKVIIAGGQPTPVLKEMVDQYNHIELVANPSEDEMNRLKQEAHIHVLYSGQSTGMKLKLIDSISQGRFVIANSHMVVHAELLSEVIVVEEWADYIDAINDLFIDVFTQEHLEKREKLIASLFSNAQNTELLLQSIFAK